MSSRFTTAIRLSDRALPAPVRALLRASISHTLVFFHTHERDNLRLVRAHLRELLDDKPTTLQAQNLRTAFMMLQAREFAFHQAFRKALHATLEEEAQHALPEAAAQPNQPHDGHANPMHGLTLSLVDMAEVDRIMLLERVASRFNLHHETQLNALTQRLGALLQAATPSLARNPFRPEVFVRAFSQAWEQGGFDPRASEDLLLSLQPQHCVDLGVLYRELDALLADAGIAAAPALKIKRTTPDATPANSAPPNATHSLASSAVNAHDAAKPRSHAAASPMVRHQSPAVKNTFTAPASPPHKLTQVRQAITVKARQFLRQIGWSAGPSVPVASIPTLWPPANLPLLGYLGDLQACAVTSASMPVLQNDSIASQNILRSMRDLPEVRRAPELDRGTVDALAEVFDYVFADQEIPVQMKYIIGRLQIPVLKAAMIDRDFFLSNEHPARRLVDTLAHASIAWVPEKGEADPLYTQIEHTVKRVLTEFEDNLDLFRDLLQQFSEFLFETEQQAQATIERTANEERDRELIGQALVLADQAVHARLNAPPSPAPLAKFLVPFLTKQWRDVLIQARLASDDSTVAWDAALNTMDQLIWSTQPKTQAHERRQLVAMLPDLVRSINQGLDVIEWTGEPRATFTRRLITTHMLAIRMTREPATDAKDLAQEERAGDQAMQELDARLAQHLTQSDDEYDRMAQSFTRGLWFDFSMEDGKPHRCRLTWVSPMRTRLLFTNREGFDAFVRSEREVAALLRLQRLRVVDSTPIVTRALTQLMADSADSADIPNTPEKRAA